MLKARAVTRAVMAATLGSLDGVCATGRSPRRARLWSRRRRAGAPRAAPFTFLFTDSSAPRTLSGRDRAAMRGAVARHPAVLRDAVVAHRRGSNKPQYEVDPGTAGAMDMPDVFPRCGESFHYVPETRSRFTRMTVTTNPSAVRGRHLLVRRRARAPRSRLTPGRALAPPPAPR